YCRKQEVRQVLMNLVTNARDAVVQNGSDRKIWISAASESSQDGKIVRIIVRDKRAGGSKGTLG
ncbi:MAG TPA: hypothetical protein PLH18_05055, partial [Clostridia bacterium]|nr:hypothetical protein [Clostridia bacterium]